MLKFFYRLKRKHGAVLFFVVAVMSLLIAMATTAYYTARSSYQTVVSNYDFSQLYLSATSVSDMVKDAITYETSSEKDIAGNKINYYDDLRKAMIEMGKKAVKDQTAQPAIIATSYDRSTLANPDDEAEILETVASAPLKDGVIDGVRIKISFLGTDKKNNDIGSNEKVNFYYTIETTAYYRNNTITVQDTVYNVMTSEDSGGLKPCDLTRFFTATGQQVIGGKIVKDKGRTVNITTKEISDDAYFENTLTIFTDTNSQNTFCGSMTATGTVVLDQFNSGSNIPAPNGTDRNDWFIGKDLIITGNASQVLDLNGNDLYINGDLILIYNGGNSITAENIYVGGSVYIASTQATIDGNLYVGCSGKGGDIYYGIPDNTVKSKVTDAFAKYEGKDDSAGYQKRKNIAEWMNDMTASQLTVKGDFYAEDADSVTSKLYVKGNTITDWSCDSYIIGQDSEGNDIDINKKQVSVKKDTTTGFIRELKDTTIKEIMAGGETTQFEYPSHTSKDTAYKNELIIDLSSSLPKKGKDVTVKSSDGSTITLKNEGDRLIVDIPYNSNGYILNLQNAESGPEGVDYVFHAPNGKVQEVVLKSNYTDSVSNPAFSWSGSVPSNGQNKQVIIDDGGYLSLEMGNIDGTGTYTPYNPDTTKQTVTYYAGLKEAVGTRQQLDELKQNYQNPLDSTWFSPGSSKLAPGLENKVVLFSNKNANTGDKDKDLAVNCNRSNNKFFGIIYAPNANFSSAEVTGDGTTSGGKSPIAGGIIASSIFSNLASFTYCEPDPGMLKTIFGEGFFGGGGDTPTPASRTFTEGAWTEYGSSYLG